MERKYTTTREFPKIEYEARNKKAKELMEKQGIDAILVTQQENVEYFSGLLTHLWASKYRPMVGIFPRDGEPAMVVPRLQQICTQKTSWVKDIRIWEDPSDTYDRVLCASMITHTIKDMGLAEAKIGVESGYDLRMNMPLTDFNFIRMSLPDAKFVDAREVIWGCRMLKSPLEREKIRKACEITSKSIEQTYGNLKSGMTEQDLSRMLSVGFLENGADEIGFLNVRISSDPWRAQMSNSYAYDVPIKKGDLVEADVGAKYGSYYADQTRYAFCGEPSQDIRNKYGACASATDAAVEAIAPGVRICDIYKIAVDTLKEKTGEVPPILRVGHGIGLEVHEPPNIGPKIYDTLKPGMIITIEPIIFSPKGVMFAEDTVCVTDKGHENYTKIKKEFYILN